MFWYFNDYREESNWTALKKTSRFCNFFSLPSWFLQCSVCYVCVAWKKNYRSLPLPQGWLKNALCKKKNSLVHPFPVSPATSSSSSFHSQKKDNRKKTKASWEDDGIIVIIVIVHPKWSKFVILFSFFSLKHNSPCLV